MENQDQQQDQQERLFYGFGEWGNPYRSNDSEYFMVGPYLTRAEAMKAVKRRHEKGQPQSFRDWVSGRAKVVEGKDNAKKSLEKMGMPVPKSLYERDLECPALWRLN